MVISGEIEFAILSGASAEDRRKATLQLRELFREPLLLAAPVGHPLTVKKNLPHPEEIDPSELIHLSEGHCLADRTRRIWRGCKQDYRLQCDQISTALAMVSAGMGVTIVPKLASRAIPHGNIVCRAFAGKGMERPVHLLKLRRSRLTPAAEKLIGSLVKS